MVSTASGKKRFEFVHQDSNAAIHIRRYTVLKTIPTERTECNLEGQPPRLEKCNQKLKLIAGGRSKKAEKCLHVGIALLYGRGMFSLL